MQRSLVISTLYCLVLENARAHGQELLLPFESLYDYVYKTVLERI